MFIDVVGDCASLLSRPESVSEDSGDFEEFFRAHHRRLLGTLCLVSGDVAESEELTQEAFVRVWERWDRLQGHPNPAGYLYRTAFNLRRDRLRRLRRAARRLAGLETAEDAFARVEASTDLAAAIRRLTPRQRAALVLTDLLELSSPEAAKLLGVRPATVRVLGAQARGALRAEMEDSDA